MEPTTSLPTAFQSISSLLSVLPLEIRTQTWTFSMRNQDIHLDVSASTDKLILTQPLPNHNLISLLLMCRQTYAESHSLMFTTSTFHIPNPSTLHALTTSLQPSTLSLLRAINTIYPLPALPTVTDFYIVNLESRGYTPLHDIVDWMSMWDTLRSLDGLRTLKVVLRVVSGQREGWRRREEEILGVFVKRGRGMGRGVESLCLFSRGRSLWGNMALLELEGRGREGKQKRGKRRKNKRRRFTKAGGLRGVVHDERNVFSLSGVWNMQRELERVWDAQNTMFP